MASAYYRSAHGEFSYWSLLNVHCDSQSHFSEISVKLAEKNDLSTILLKMFRNAQDVHVNDTLCALGVVKNTRKATSSASFAIIETVQTTMMSLK